MTDNTTDKFVTHLESVCKSIRFWPSWKQGILGFCPIQTIERKIRMTTEYPLTLAEARAALVNELPRTEIERKSDNRRWRRPSRDAWMVELLIEGKQWRACSYGPMCTCEYRIIPIGHPDHSEYISPEPAYKLLTADEALAGHKMFIIEPRSYFLTDGDYHVEAMRFSKGTSGWTPGAIALAYEAQRQGWPIVATREEAEAVLKERGSV